MDPARSFAFLLILAIGTLALPLQQDEFQISPYINGGVNVKQGQYPFVVAFTRPGYTDCAGTILTKDWLLTAGTCCFFVGHEFQAYVGSVSLKKKGQFLDVNSTHYHPEFEVSDDAGLTHPNDICLVKLKKSLTFNDRIQQVTLPPADYPFAPNTSVSVLGWGAKNSSYWATSKRLKIQTGLHAYPESCPIDSQFPSSYTPFVGMICVQNDAAKHSACSRDEGGPLLYKDYIQIGLFSYYHHGTCDVSRASTFVRIAHYVPWIQAMLGPDASQLKIASYKEVPCRFSYCSPW